MIWQRVWGGLSSASAGVRTTDEAHAFLQKRIAFFGRIGCLLALGFYVLAHLALATRPGYSWRAWLEPDGLLHLATAGLLGVVWRIAKGAPREAHTLAALDAGGAILACLSSSLPVLLADATVDHRYRMLLVITNALIARAAVVPTPARWTLKVSAAAAVPAVLFTWIFQARHPGAGGAAYHTIVSLLWCTVAAAVSTVVSQIIYGLRQEVREARQLGQYTLEEKLGEGGMGQVFRARHAMLRRPTAVKLLPPGKAGEGALKRFEREVQLTAILTHPNTVHVFDYGRTADGVFYYAMELLEGLNLDQLVNLHGAQPPARAVHILRQVVSALAEAHGIGLIHRDVKPANVILCERGGVPDVAKVFDFGLVRFSGTDQDASLTAANTITGTPLFLSPEAIQSPDAVDARSDLYAVGGVAYHLLTAHHVFEGRSVVEICGHHLHTAPTPPSERLGAPLPEGLDALVLWCLEKDADRRPSSARELLARLDVLAASLPWTEADAREWWSARAVSSGPPAATGGSDTTSGISQALTVDLRERTEPASG